MLLNTVIEEQQILSKQRRVPADIVPGPSLKWVIEIEKTHTDRLLSLLRSVFDQSVSIVAVRESTAGSIPVTNVGKSKSVLKNVPSRACSSFIYSNINMVVDTNLPAEAFRSVHRMFFVPHSCSDPIQILNHPIFLDLFDTDSWNLSSTKEREAKAEGREEKRNLTSKMTTSANISLKIQTSPKELKSCLAEMIHSRILEISKKRESILQSCQYENEYKDVIVNCNHMSSNYSLENSDGRNLKIDLRNNNNCYINNSQFHDKENSNYSSFKNKNNVDNDIVEDGEYTHLLQCIYGVEDSVFRWGLVSTEESVRSRLLSVSLDSDIERDRLKRMQRDTQLYESQNDIFNDKKLSRIAPSDINNNFENKNFENKNDIDCPNYGITPNENYEIFAHRNSVTKNLKSENKLETKIYENKFLPASRAYYKMSEIKEFYFPLWGWIWPGCDYGRLIKKENSLHSVMQKNIRNGRLKCNAVDVGASPGGWTQCLTAHCVNVISIDPGKAIDLEKKWNSIMILCDMVLF